MNQEAGAAPPIVDRMRNYQPHSLGGKGFTPPLCDEAADTIEELVGALEDAAACIRGDIQGPAQLLGILREIDALLAKLEAGEGK
jgi:hypothetical protein